MTAVLGLAQLGLLELGAGEAFGPSGNQGDGEVSPSMNLGVSNPNPDESE